MKGALWTWYIDLKRILEELRKHACDCGCREYEDPDDHAEYCPYRNAVSAGAEQK